MSYLITTLIFINLLGVMFAEQPTIVPDVSVETEKQAAEIFAEIKPNEVLPLVFFKILKSRHYLSSLPTETYTLQIPQFAFIAVVLNGRMVQGTEFFTKYSDNQIFFCPEKNSEENCLVSQTFGESEPLQCAKEPTPVLQKENRAISCGPQNDSISYTIIYKICPNQEYATKNIEIFSICYITNEKKTLYTTHTILNPRLLESNLLFRERNVPYPVLENDELKPLNFEGVNDASSTDLNVLTHPKKPAYKAQKFVPDRDMAFALWRKATYESFNFDWQHEILIPLWDKINNYVRYEAIQMIVNKIEFHVQTSLFDIVPASADDATISNLWVKMITTTPQRPYKNIRGIAILMNNFITSTTSDSKTLQSAIDEIIAKNCNDNLCLNSLQEEFKNIGGRVYCCPITYDMAEVFNWQNIVQDLGVLDIPGINTEFVLRE